jgi:nitroreductase
MNKPAISSVPLAPVLNERWSPRAFDSTHQISKTDLLGILEAGRWAPSANNIQPWRFVIAHRGDANFQKITSTLAGFNQVWLPTVSVIIAVFAVTKTPEGEKRIISHYDAGLAAAMMTIEAHHRGLAVHHVAGFDHDALAKDFSTDDSISPIILLGIGKQTPAENLVDENIKSRELAPRERKPLSELILAGDY